MGISLGDLGSFAMGAINEDKKNTAAKLEERKDELKANRAFILKMKESKYQSELNSFEEENKKAKAISNVNNKYKSLGGEVNPIDYGRDYLLATNPTEFATMTALLKDNPPKLEAYYSSFANKASSEFKPTTTREALDMKQAADIQSITAEFNKKIEDARGDSFLVNQIINLKNKALNKVTEKNKAGEAGTILAKEIQKEIETVKPDEGDTGLTFAKISYSKPIVPEWFKTQAKLEEKRTKLNSADNLKSYSDAGIKAGIDFFKSNKFAKINEFISKDKDGKYIGFEGAGAMVVNHISLLGNGATDSITDMIVYTETGGKATMASSVLNTSVVKGKVTERVNDYTNISQSKNFLSDTKNIVAIVPFSIVDANNTLGDVRFETKGNRKTVGESYYKALQQFTKENNIRQIGNDENNKPIYSIIKSNQQFMNDIQTELLNLRGNTNNTANRIKELMIIDLGINTDNKTLPQNNDSPASIDINTSSSSTPVKTMQVEINGDIVTMIDNEESREVLAEDIKQGADIKIIETIKRPEKIVDSMSTETTVSPTKKIPADFGIVNQPVFETLESILKVIKMPMTGEEIKNTFDISPGLKINSKTTFRPLS